MAYEIPQQLTYKEKIIFGLTFKQLGYALGFGMSILALLKFTDHSSKWAIGLLLATICTGFMFLGLWEHLRDWWAFLKFREAFLLHKSMSDYLEIEKIEDGAIHVKNNKKN